MLKIAELEKAVNALPGYRAQSLQIQSQLQDTDKQILAACTDIKNSVLENQTILNDRLDRLEKHFFFRQKVASLTPAFLGCSAWLSPALAVSISPAHPAPVVRVPSTGRLEVRPC